MIKKSAVISIIGKPNSGKSTLLNRLINYRLSIITPKAQTTRDLIKGIITKDNLQLIILDTPGIFEPKRKLDQSMVRAAWSSVSGADIILFMHDATTKLDDQSIEIIKKLARTQNPFFILLNKTDIAKIESENIKESLSAHNIDPTLILGISALNGNNVAQLEQELEKFAPQREWLYDEEEITTLPMKFIASEITREELFLQLGNELPYNLLVDSETWQTNEDGSATVSQVIITNREAHKKMIIGKNGQKIKNIGIKARQKITAFLELNVHLKLFVKVREDWDNKSYYLPKTQ